jgi:hypothetical protein
LWLVRSRFERRVGVSPRPTVEDRNTLLKISTLTEIPNSFRPQTRTWHERHGPAVEIHNTWFIPVFVRGGAP